MGKEDCIFCRIVNGEIPSHTLYEDERFRVILDLGPAARGHALIIPKKHMDNLFEISDEVACEILSLAKRMAGRMMEKLHCAGINLLQNNGSAAGQTVNHFHIHIIPRYENDGILIDWNDGEPSGEELEAVRRQITE